MTNDQNEISQEEQTRWFDSIDRMRFVPLLSVLAEPFEDFPEGYPVGYGISRVAEVGGEFRKLITGGITYAFRGKGLGEELFRDVITWAGIPCWLEVLDSNRAALGLYKKLGFKVLDSSYQKIGDKTCTLMRLDAPPL
jgi:ribosomal protein S18 acetylase RimI-like enzyme